MRTVVITGGFGALGRHVAMAFAAQGDHIALIDAAAAPAPDGFGLDRDPLLLGGVELSDWDAAVQAMAQVHAWTGRVDVLVNLAGGFAWQTLEDGNPQTWDRLYTINLRTTVCSSKAALPYLLAHGNGRIINTGAHAAAKAGPGMGAYAAAKAGVAKLTQSLAEELKDRGVTVNAVLPSILDTPANRADMPDANVAKWVRPAELAAAIVFLASPQASAITGALVPVVGRL